MNSTVIKNGGPPHTLTGGSQSPDTTNQGIVACGIDTLVIGFCVQLYLATETDFLALSTAKLKAGEKQFNKSGCPITWFGKDFVVKPKGVSGYEWVISNEDVSICIAERAQSGKVYPEIRVTFRSVYLWGDGYVKAYERIREWLDTWCLITGEKVSRCDLTVDMAIELPEINIKTDFVGRARNKPKLPTS